MPVACKACQKTYVNSYNLNQHLQRQPLCSRWLSLNESVLRDYVDAEFSLPATEDEREIGQVYCGVCQTSFANVGNLNRHMKENLVCGKWARYRELVPLSTYMTSTYSDVAWDKKEPERFPGDLTVRSASAADTDESNEPSILCKFESPAYKLLHVLWNLFLVDKEFVAKPDFENVLEAENVKRMIAILPKNLDERYTADGRSIDGVLKQLSIKVRIEILEYSDHVPLKLDAVTIHTFDCICKKIEQHRSKRENVFVFCNSGHQRSIPFLVYFFTKFHPEEAPTVERAIDLILPSVDRERYAEVRPEYVKTMNTLFEKKASLG